MAGKGGREARRIVAPGGDEAVQLGQLALPQRALHLDRAQVVARQDKAELPDERVGIAGQVGVVGQVARPAMRAQRQQRVVKPAVVGKDHAAFHRRDVVRKEARERAAQTKGSRLPAIQPGPHRFAIILDQHQPTRVAEPTQATTCAVTATITNGNTLDIQELIVRDMVPVGKGNVRVRIQEPAGLAQAKNGEAVVVPVGDGTRQATVRWSNVEGEKDGLRRRKSGMYEWVCAVEAGSKLELKTEWDVRAPVGEDRL